MEHAPGPKSRFECRIRWIVGEFRFLFRIQVIEVAEELVESVHGRQELIAIAEMVLAKLTGGVTERLEQFGDGRVVRLKSENGAGQSDFGQAGAERVLPGDEGCATGSAALLAVPVGEFDAFLGDAVDVRSLVAHHAIAVATDIPVADVIAPQDQKIRLLCSHDLSPY